MSGYVHCACRDCMDVAISATDAPAMCLSCKVAGCEIPYEFIVTGEGGSDCEREDAYEDVWQPDTDAMDEGWGDWLEATHDPDSPRYDTLEEQNGHA